MNDVALRDQVDMSFAPNGGYSDSAAMIESPMQKAMEAREVANIQAKIFMAKRFPRNYADVLKRIDSDCSREALASQAVYEYSRGGTKITGPSIRLAETLARAFGNIESVTEVLSQTDEASLVRVYSWDYESNRQANRTFFVRHERDTKKGKVKLTDNRDITEAINNIAARNRRACILELIPGDYVEHALDVCDKTLRAKVKITPDTLQTLLEAFKPFGVTRAMIEARLQRSLESISINQYLDMRRIYTSLKDGMGKPEDFFDLTLDDHKVEQTLPNTATDKNHPKQPKQQPNKGEVPPSAKTSQQDSKPQRQQPLKEEPKKEDLFDDEEEISEEEMEEMMEQEDYHDYDSLPF